MMFNSLRYCLRQCFVSLRRNFWLVVVTACIIAVSLAILGGFLLIVVNVNKIIANVESSVEIAAFLLDGADVADIGDRIIRLEGVEEVRFVSKDEGLVEFGKSLGDEELLAGLEWDANPLPDVFRIKAVSADIVPQLAEEIGAIEGVEFADYGEELVSRLLNLTGWLNTLFMGISVLLALGAVFLIVTTIRLSVIARQEEISIMKYLGASDAFIRFPFLLEGMIMGWLGTLASTMALGAVYNKIAAFLQQDALIFFLRPVTSPEKLAPIFIGLILLGTLMGGIGSTISIRRFLRV
jgi:cell division transport system permease protein